MRMPGADTHPDNFGVTFLRKLSKTDQRQKESPNLDCAEVFAQTEFHPLGHTLEKAKGEMHLIGIDPTHTANLWVKIDQVSAD